MMNSSQYVLQGVEPRAVLYYFEEISRIPRASGNEAQVAEYLVRFAGERALQCVRDANNNVLISKRATAGRENEAPLLLQGHTDMVCEKNSDVSHDFDKDPIRLVLCGNELSADGTTLGADKPTVY